MHRDERLVGGLDDPELEPEPLRVGECQPVAVARDVEALARQALLPEVERRSRSDPPDDRVHHPPPCAAAAGARVLEEGDVGAGAPGLVGVEQVIDGRVVLVHRFLDQAQPEDARVEVDVPGRVARDRRHVVDALQLHDAAPPLRVSTSYW